jgi:TRAP-type C4-dicarboxylate transport system permease small subunit
MLAITTILFAGVVWRYFFAAPRAWPDEIARLAFVWLAFIGAALGVKRGLHASVTILADRLPPHARRLCALLVVVVTAAVAIVLVVVGGRQTASAFGQEAMPVTGLSTGWSNLPVPISGILMLIYLVPHVLAPRYASSASASAETQAAP